MSEDTKVPEETRPDEEPDAPETDETPVAEELGSADDKSEAEPVAETVEPAAETPAEADTAAEPVASINPRLRWYVLHTYSGHEQKAKRHLESAIVSAGLADFFGRIIMPTEQVTEMKQGRKSTSTRKFLPSYLLVEMDLNKETRHLVTNSPGITNFVGAGGKPQPLEPDEVERIIGHMEKGPVLKTDEMPYSAGDAVKVTDGPFADFSGIVSEVIPERKKLKVMVSIFGRPTPVELDYLQVQPA
jgi:transcriptional antiterminator NusG